MRHLEILPQKAKIKAKASHDEVLKALAELRIPVLEKGKATYKKKEKSAKTKAEKKTGLLEKIVGPKKEEKKVEKPKGATKKPAKKPATKKTPAKKPAAKKPATKKKTPAKKK